MSVDGSMIARIAALCLGSTGRLGDWPSVCSEQLQGRRRYACATLTLRWHHPTTALQRYTFSPLFPLQSNITAVPVPCQRAAVPRARDTTAQRYTVNCFRGALCCSLKKLLCKFCFFNFFPKYFSPACISEWMAIWF